MVKVQEWLDREYPIEKRAEIINLDISNQNLEGYCNLDSFVNLISLDCSFNQLTSLNLPNLNQLEEISFSNNNLIGLDYSFLNPEKLIWLNISDNNLTMQNLSVFSHLINLKLLWIGNDDKEKIEKGFYNRFTGSLEFLKDLTSLEGLHIDNTDIDNGVDYLPNSMKEIYYSTKERPETEVKKLAEQLIAFLVRESSHPELDKWIRDKWEGKYFSYKQTKKWIENDLQPSNINSANYLRWKGYEHALDLNSGNSGEKIRNTHEWLGREYPKKEREKITHLDISGKKLEGYLKLKGFINLQWLSCHLNNLTDLDLSNCHELRHLSCYANLLTNTNFLSKIPNPEKLISLDIGDNNFTPQDLVFLKPFVNLESLQVWTCEKERIQGNIYNRFYGSLQPLKNLIKLKELAIVNTDIDDGLEYLPESLKKLSYWVDTEEFYNKEEARVNKLLTILEPYKSSRGKHYNHQVWKINQPFFQWLKEELKRSNPHLNNSDIFKFLSTNNIFFNVKEGTASFDKKTLFSFFKQSIEISKKEERIKLLESTVRGLWRLIIEQTEKIKDKIESHINETVVQKELLKKYVQVYTELKKTEIKKVTDVEELNDLEDQVDDIYNKLKKELGKEGRNILREIKQDCDNLVDLEIKLEDRLNRELVLDFAWQVQNINNINAPINVYQGHAFIGNQTGNNANFSYRQITNNTRETKLGEITEELLTTNIEQQTK